MCFISNLNDWLIVDGVFFVIRCIILLSNKTGKNETSGIPVLGKKNFKFSIEYSIGFLLIVFYRIFANSFL